MQITDKVILRELLLNNDYFLAFSPHLKGEMFNNIECQTIFNTINDIANKTNKHPSVYDVKMHFEGVINPNNEKLINCTISTLNEIVSDDTPVIKQNLDSLTETWIKKQLFQKSIMEGADLINGDISNMDKVLSDFNDIMSISFDRDLGISSLDVVKRKEKYQQRKEIALTTGIAEFDALLGGGFMKNTLNIVGAITHGGKSLFLSHLFAYNLKQGKNGIYISLEMKEEDIWRRIDANVLQHNVNKIEDIELSVLSEAYAKIGVGHIKEYPSQYCSAFTIKGYLKDLLNENGFTPDFICIDYLTLMTSSRVQRGRLADHAYLKHIAEELHSLAKELEIPIITAVQLNRGAYGKLETGVEDVGESIGISQTADTFFTLNDNDEMKQNCMKLLNITKNRNTGFMDKLVIRIDYTTMTFYGSGDNCNISKYNVEPETKEVFTKDWDDI